jgi:uncharacterized cupredoxin-like copper-binding protein
MDRKPRRWRAGAIPIIGALLVASLVASACSPARSIPEIAISSADYSFQLPASIPAGLVRAKLTNSGREPHHAQFMRLNDGVTMEQFQAALQQSEEHPEQVLSLVALMGGPATIDPNGSVEVVLNLTAGQYVLACFVSSPDGAPHLAKGMLKPLQVTAAAGPAPAEPQAGGTVRLKDFSFDLPDRLTAGTTTFKVVNDGPQPHELSVLRLAEGKSTADVAAFFESEGPPAGPPPFQGTGGMQGLSRQQAGYWAANLTPGHYLALCLIPDPESGKSHAELGMVKEFAVG